MKIRQGFVTNSSSSSFIVKFKSKPDTVESVKEQLFNDKEVVSFYDKYESTDTISKIVFKDIKRQEQENFIYNDFLYSIDFYPEDGKTYSKDFVMKQLINDKVKSIVDYHNCLKKFCETYIIPRSEFFQHSNYKMIKKFEKEFKKTVNEESKKIIAELEKNGFFGDNTYIFTYSDECGESLLEHGDIFAELEYVHISHH